MALDLSHIELKKPQTKQTWSGVEVVDYLATLFDIPKSGPYGYSSWLRRVKNANLSLFQAQKVASIMRERESWLKSKGETLHRGKWWFNRFRYDFKDMGVDSWISKNSY